MATTIASAGIVTAANQALVAAQKDINIIKNFAYDMSGEFDVNGTVRVPVVTAGALSSLDLADADFEDPSGSLTYVDVKLTDLIRTTMSYTGADKIECANSPFVDKFAVAMANKIDAYLSQKIGAIFGDTAITTEHTLGTISKSNLAKLRNAVAGRIANTILVLSPDNFAETLALFDSQVYGSQDAIKNGQIPGLYGFKTVMECKDLPDGVKGALISEDAIAFASRAVPVADESVYTEYGVVNGEAGFSLTAMRHGTPRNGKAYVNMCTYFGTKVVMPSNIVKLV